MAEEKEFTWLSSFMAITNSRNQSAAVILKELYYSKHDKPVEISDRFFSSMTGLVKDVSEVMTDEKRRELVLGTHKTKRIPQLVIILNDPDSHYQWQAKALIEGNSETLANIQELLKMLKPRPAGKKSSENDIEATTATS